MRVAGNKSTEKALVEALEIAWTLLSYRDVEQMIEPESYKKAKYKARIASEMAGKMIVKSNKVFCPDCHGEVKPSEHKSLPEAIRGRRAFGCGKCNKAYFSDQVRL